MPTFAVIDNNKVVNLIISDTKEIAEEITGKICIEATDENGACMGADWDNTSFTVAQPDMSTKPNDENIWFWESFTRTWHMGSEVV
jgi:hypothetical protein